MLYHMHYTSRIVCKPTIADDIMNILVRGFKLAGYDSD